jgi:hypothetical protein
MKSVILVLPIALLLGACEQSELEKSARAHAEVQAGINVMKFERAERDRNEGGGNKEGEEEGERLQSESKQQLQSQDGD